MKRTFFWECGSRRRELSAFESGELSPERASHFAAHLAVCSRCRLDWESLSGVAALLRAEPPAAASPAPDLWSRIESELLVPPPQVAPSVWRRPAFALSIGGALAATACAAFVAVRSEKNAPQAPLPTMAASVASAPKASPAPIVVAKAVKVAPPVIYREPVETPTPAPVRKAPRRRTRTASRPDPFAPVAVARVRPARRHKAADDSPPVVAKVDLLVAVKPSGLSAKIEKIEPSASSGTVPDETHIAAAKPAPATMALRDPRTDAELAERRSAAAMASPLDAVDRASRARRLFP